MANQRGDGKYKSGWRNVHYGMANQTGDDEDDSG